MQEWLVSKNFHQRICVAPTDLRCLQSNPCIAARCPAEISGLSNHNTESVRASSWTQVQYRYTVYMISDFHSSGIKRLPTYSGAIGTTALELGAVDFLTKAGQAC
jgi:hypothetical protein